MTSVRWVNFMHIYQPIWQSRTVVDQVAAESYTFIIDTLKKFPNFHLTLNISGVLVETLMKTGHENIIEDLKKLIAADQIELTGSSHHHAFLPQLPESEIERQIKLHEDTIHKYLTPKKMAGFFLPEMAYSPRVGSIIKEHGYEWVILDPISTQDTVTSHVKYRDHRTGLVVVFRNRQLSKAYPPEAILKLLTTEGEQTVITATDGELYGHFHKDWQDHLQIILQSSQIKSCTIGEYLSTLSATQPVHLRSASWETKSRNVRTNNPFTIWFNTSNPIHRKLWQLADTAIANVTAKQNDPNHKWARLHLDRGLASCSWWWASGIKTSVFGPIAWNPDEVEKGALELIKSIRSLQSVSVAEKIKAEKLYASLLENLWTKHWNLYARKTH